MSNEKPARIPLHVGATVWLFSRGDTATRWKVTGETSRSWILSDGTKIPKATVGDVAEVDGSMTTLFYCLTREAAARMLLERSRHQMAWKLKEMTTDVAVLKQIAALLGMPAGVED